MFLWARHDKHGTPGRDVWTGSTGLGSAAAMSQRRSGGLESAAIWRAWGSGNPGTRQPAGGLGIATAGGPNRARDQRTRGDPAELPRIIRGLERDDERRLPCREKDRTQEPNKRLLKTKNKTGWMGAAYGLGLVFCHGAHSREEQGHADEEVNSKYYSL